MAVFLWGLWGWKITSVIGYKSGDHTQTFCEYLITPSLSLNLSWESWENVLTLRWKICIKVKAVFYLSIPAVLSVLCVLHCGCWILAVCCCGWWVVRRVCCWLWLTWNHFFGDSGPGQVEEPHESILMLWQVIESWEGGNNQHRAQWLIPGQKFGTKLVQSKENPCISILLTLIFFFLDKLKY